MKCRMPFLIITLFLAACAATEPMSPTIPGPSGSVATITWDAVAAAPVGRFEAQSAVVDDKFFVMGGYTDPSILPISFEADMYDPETDTWTRLPGLPRPITHAGSAADGENIYLAGGVVGSANPAVRAKLSASSEVWRYHVPTQTWSALPPLPEPRGAGALAVVEGELHFFGGTTGNRYTQVGDHWTLSLDGGTDWETAVPLPNPRNHLSSVVLGGKIYAIGGQHGHNETLVTQRSVHVWDPETPERWTELASLPYGLGHTSNATLAYQGRIYVIGGETKRFVFSDAVLVYDPAADLWTTTTSFPSREHSLLAGIVGDRVFVTGGSNLSLRTLRGILSGR
jgi:N-acetylneuraminic acid mutarotase